MTTIINTSVSEARSMPRVWVEGQKLAQAGVNIGVGYMARLNKQLSRIELVPAPPEFKGKLFMVSKRTRKDRVSPLIEIRDAILNEIFEVGSKVRVAIRNGRIILSVSHMAQRVKERVERFRDKINKNEALSCTSLFHGGGILDKALHSGFKRAGLSSFLKVAVEQEGEYLDSSLANNPELFTDESTLIVGDIQEINLVGSNFPTCEVIVGGIPCVGASRSGISKNKLARAEDHLSAGSLFSYFLDFVKVMNPAIVIIENVVEYLKSVSMTVIRSVLTNLGYELSETVIDGHELGSLEKRKRMVLVATTPGLCDIVNFEDLVSVRERETSLSEILDEIPETSDRWKSYSYLASKAVRDKSDGKGFVRQLLSGKEDGCGVIGRGYFKARSTEPFLVSPYDNSLSRLFTVAEHARIKTIPESAVEGLSETKAHEVLGQSVIFCAFVAVGELIAKTVLSFNGSKSKSVNSEMEKAQYSQQSMLA